MVGASFWRKERTGPKNGVSFRVEVFDSVVAFEIEARKGVDALEELTLAIIHLFLVEIISTKAVFIALPRSVAEGLNDVGNSAPMLMLSEAEEVLADGFHLCLCLGRIESGVHVFGNAEGVVIHHGLFVILWHGSVDVFCERLDRFFANEGFVVFIGDSLSAITVAGSALLLVDDGSAIATHGEDGKEGQKEPKGHCSFTGTECICFRGIFLEGLGRGRLEICVEILGLWVLGNLQEFFLIFINLC